MLALSFLLLIGMSLILEGFDHHIPKGYIYFAMGFSVFVEMINLRLRKVVEPVHLHERYTEADSSPGGRRRKRRRALKAGHWSGVLPSMLMKRVLLAVLAAALVVPLVHPQAAAPTGASSRLDRRRAARTQSVADRSGTLRGAFQRPAHDGHDRPRPARPDHGARSSTTARMSARSWRTLRIDVKGIDTHNAKRDDHLRSADFFDVAKSPRHDLQIEAGRGGRGRHASSSSATSRSAASPKRSRSTSRGLHRR